MGFPLVGDLLGKPLSFSLFTDSSFLISVGILYVFGSFISGIYPAFVLSTFKPIDVFKSGAHSIAKGKSILRQSLVVFQFIVSIGLIMGTIIIYNQLNFVKSMELGFNHKQTLVLNSPRTIISEIELLAYKNITQKEQQKIEQFIAELVVINITQEIKNKTR